MNLSSASAEVAAELWWQLHLRQAPNPVLSPRSMSWGCRHALRRAGHCGIISITTAISMTLQSVVRNPVKTPFGYFRILQWDHCCPPHIPPTRTRCRPVPYSLIVCKEDHPQSGVGRIRRSEPQYLTDGVGHHALSRPSPRSWGGSRVGVWRVVCGAWCVVRRKRGVAWGAQPGDSRPPLAGERA